MRFPRRWILVVPEAVAAAANNHAAQVDRRGGGQTFTVGLSASGAAPATHYWCGWQLTDDADSRIRARLQTLIDAGVVRVFDGSLRTPASVLGELGLRPVEG
jgi:hypothetical protein